MQFLSHPNSNTSRNKEKVPDPVAQEYEHIVADILERRGHDFNVFIRRVRQRFNNPNNYFGVSQSHAIYAMQYMPCTFSFSDRPAPTS